jgi:hypothetical protein
MIVYIYSAMIYNKYYNIILVIKLKKYIFIKRNITTQIII